MKTEEIKVNIMSSATHRGPQKSTTLNRRYVKRPTKLVVTDGTEEVETPVVEEKAEAPKVKVRKTRKIAIDAEPAEAISHMNVKEEAAPEMPEIVDEAEDPDLPPAPNPYQAALDAKKAERAKRRKEAISSKALKDAAIARALSEMREQEPVSRKTLREESIAERVMLTEMAEERGLSKKDAKKAAKRSIEKATKFKKKTKRKRILLAFVTSTACVLALGLLVKANLPDISVRVAAMQTGIEASYPSYLPRDFSLTGVYTNEKNEVIIDFNGPEGKKFTLLEEKSSWDSNALLKNYVKVAYGDNYDVIREQGITIYVNYSNAAWVKDGVAYKITASVGTLTKRQIKNIVTSL